MQSTISSRRVLLFIRAPELGKVKTRLAKKMDTDTVLALYRCFVADIIKTLTLGGYDTTVYFTPSHKKSMVQEWLGRSISIQAQTGSNLGEKMHNAFTHVFSTGVDQAILIGSDLPDIDIDIIHEAFAFLEKKDMTIGPATDGGYYLIGFRKNTFNGHVFTDIDWGSEAVYRQTLERIRYAGLNDHILPSWEDIDTYDDLGIFYQRNKTNKGIQLKTMQFINRINLRDFK